MDSKQLLSVGRHWKPAGLDQISFTQEKNLDEILTRRMKHLFCVASTKLVSCARTGSY